MSKERELLNDIKEYCLSGMRGIINTIPLCKGDMQDIAILKNAHHIYEHFYKWIENGKMPTHKD